MKIAIRYVFGSKILYIGVYILLCTVNIWQDPDEHERMEAVNPEEHFPPSASEEIIELLNLIFGVGRERLPSAEEILRVATIFNKEKTGTYSIYIGSAVPSSVYRKHPARKKTGSYSLYKSILLALGLLVLFFFYHYFYDG